MIFLPKRLKTINLNYSPKEVVDKLVLNLEEPTKWYQIKWPFKGKEFEGEVFDDHFEIKSMDDGSKYSGEIEDCGNQCSITFTIKKAPETDQIINLCVGSFAFGMLLAIFSAYSFMTAIELEIESLVKHVIYPTVFFLISGVSFKVWLRKVQDTIDTNVKKIEVLLKSQTMQTTANEWWKRGRF